MFSIPVFLYLNIYNPYRRDKTMKYLAIVFTVSASMVASGCVWSVPLVAVGAGAAVNWDQKKCVKNVDTEMPVAAPAPMPEPAPAPAPALAPAPTIEP
jgi:hypothetical protein